MNDDERYTLMKQRIIRSFKWREDIVIPMAKEFEISVDEMEDIFMTSLDMSSIECLHSTFDSAKYLALKEQFYIDLRLFWLSGTLELITVEEAEDLKLRLANEVYMNGRDYDEVLAEGRQEILQKLKSIKGTD